MLDLMFGDGAAYFAVPALLGTGVFVLRVVLMTTGVGGGEWDVDAGGGGGGGGGHHADSSHVFEVLSIQSLFAFAMGFGWSGLGGLRGLNWDMSSSVAIGVVGGVAMVWLLGTLLRGIHELQTSGNVSIDDAVGAEGEVYVSVPAGAGGGGGQVRVVIGGRQRIFNAMTEGEALATGTRVRVLRVSAGRTLCVVRA